MQIKISSKKIVKILMAGVAFLVLMHGLTQTAKFAFGRDHLLGLVPFFDLDLEYNLPSVFSFLLLLMAGKLLGWFAYDAFTQRARFAAVWAVWSLIFVLFALDELLGFHEKLGWMMGEYFKTGGVIYYVWQIPYLLVFLLIIFYSFSLWKSLDQKFCRTCITAGGLYLFATVVMECLSGWYASIFAKDAVYVSMITVEETLEMCGIILFIYALLEHARTTIRQITIEWEEPR